MVNGSERSWTNFQKTVAYINRKINSFFIDCFFFHSFNTKNPRPFSAENLPQKIPIDKNFQKTREENYQKVIEREKMEKENHQKEIERQKMETENYQKEI